MQKPAMRASREILAITGTINPVTLAGQMKVTGG
jgi:hypothetical protein